MDLTKEQIAEDKQRMQNIINDFTPAQKKTYANRMRAKARAILEEAYRVDPQEEDDVVVCPWCKGKGTPVLPDLGNMGGDLCSHCEGAKTVVLSYAFVETIMVRVSHSAHGSFLTTFAKAYCYADLANRKIMRSSTVALIKAYGLERYLAKG